MPRDAPFKVLHVGKFYPPHPGGMESHLQTLCEELSKSIEVQALVASDRWRRERSAEGGVELVRLATPLMLQATPIVPLMARAMRQARADLVHLHFPNPMAAIACLMSRLRVPLVVTWHSDVVRQRRAAAAFAPLLSRLLARCAAIIVGSNAYIESSSVLSARRNLCRIIPFGIRAGDFEHPDIARVDELRRRHGERIVLGVGRLIYYKGFEILVRAMKEVRGTALIAGDGPLAGTLAAEAARLGIADRVALMGRVNDLDLKACYHTCDVFALPSVERSEAFGIVQLEAMASGKPVVNTRLDSAVPHVSLDGLTGLTVAPGDPAALAAALNALLDDPGRRAEMGAAARRRVREQFGAELMAQRTLELYREVVAGGARAGRTI
ncbi:MAG TPA: glycosyltransferase [Candidatus Binataceae bacterium]|nr:glycosyltransferase [Candidatus Binataceae bacterium]